MRSGMPLASNSALNLYPSRRFSVVTFGCLEYLQSLKSALSVNLPIGMSHAKLDNAYERALMPQTKET
jgi:hypothetical protein